MKKLLFFCVVSGFIFVGSCAHEPTLMPGTAEVCFDTKVLPVIQSNCAVPGCHNGSGEFSLSSFEEIRGYVTPNKPVASDLYKVISKYHTSPSIMPPKPREPLTRAQIENINLWILQGANHTTCGEGVCDSVNVTFTADILPITDTYCKGCHSGSNPSGGFVLVDHATVKAAVDAGRFMGSIQWSDGFIKMPQDAAKLSVCNIAMIKKWVNDGMLDN